MVGIARSEVFFPRLFVLCPCSLWFLHGSWMVFSMVCLISLSYFILVSTGLLSTAKIFNTSKASNRPVLHLLFQSCSCVAPESFRERSSIQENTKDKY